MKITKKKILLKSFFYRIFASIIVQIGVWFLFQEISYNFVVFVGDIIRFGGYFIFEWGWNKFELDKGKMAKKEGE